MKRLTFEEIVRRAITSSQLTRYQISKQTGVSQAALSRFVNGERSISLDTLEKLRDVLGLDLRQRL